MDDRHFGYNQKFLKHKCIAGRELQTLILTIPCKPLLVLGGVRERDENTERRTRERETREWRGERGRGLGIGRGCEIEAERDFVCVWESCRRRSC